MHKSDFKKYLVPTAAFTSREADGIKAIPQPLWVKNPVKYSRKQSLTDEKPDCIQKQRIKATGTIKKEKKETCLLSCSSN